MGLTPHGSCPCKKRQGHTGQDGTSQGAESTETPPASHGTCGRPAGAATGQEGLSPQASEGAPPTPFQTSEHTGCCVEPPSWWHVVATRQSIRTRTHQARWRHTSWTTPATLLHRAEPPCAQLTAPPPSLRPQLLAYKTGGKDKPPRVSSGTFTGRHSQATSASPRASSEAKPHGEAARARPAGTGSWTQPHTPQAQSLEGRKRQETLMGAEAQDSHWPGRASSSHGTQ